MTGSGFYLKTGSHELKCVQALQLHLLVEVDRICRRHAVNYCLLFGTLLGQQRHGGFIPWDDDIDIGVYRQDFDRLLTILSAELDSQLYEVQWAKPDNDVTVAHAKVRCLNTGFVEAVKADQAKLQQGVFIDLFPLDVLPDDARARKKQKRDYFKVTYALRYKARDYVPRHWAKRLVLSLISLKSRAKLLDERYRIMTRHANETTHEWIAFPSSYRDYASSFIRSAGLEPFVDASFCGYSVKVPWDCKGQLTSLFGDYLTLPEASDRHGHLLKDFYIDEQVWGPILALYLPALACKTGEPEERSL